MGRNRRRRDVLLSPDSAREAGGAQRACRACLTKPFKFKRLAPGVGSEGRVLPASDTVLTRHPMQLDSAILLLVLTYVLIGRCSQDAWLARFWFLPAEHCEHADPAAPQCPDWRTHPKMLVVQWNPTLLVTSCAGDRLPRVAKR